MNSGHYAPDGWTHSESGIWETDLSSASRPANNGWYCLHAPLSKTPDLLILDEPLHGLDCCNKELARAVIEHFCERPGRTMIYVTHSEHELPACVTHRMELSRHDAPDL